MKKTILVRSAVALLVLSAAPMAFAADHLDSPSVKAGDPSADITDLYSFTDGNNVVLILDVAPLAAAGAKFSNAVQYVFHTESAAGFGAAGTKKDVICTFDAAQNISCWIGTDDYVTGNASATTGIKSASGKVQVFAGLRDDPFFFNLDGFNDTVTTVDGAKGTLTFDAAGCPAINAATSAVLVNKLKTDPNSTPPGGPAKDFFAGKNVLSIVLSIDKTLLTGGGKYLKISASTNKGM